MRKLESVGLVEPLVPDVVDATTLDQSFTNFIKRVGTNRKPGAVADWKQVQNELTKFMPKRILLSDVTKGHAKQFHESLKKRGLASLTVVKHVRTAKQILEDAVEREKIPSNPFSKIKLAASIPTSNVEVTRETITAVLEVADPTWRAIIALSRFGGLRCPSESLSLTWGDIDFERGRISIPEPKVEFHEGRGVRSCPLFPDFRTILEESFMMSSN